MHGVAGTVYFSVFKPLRGRVFGSGNVHLGPGQKSLKPGDIHENMIFRIPGMTFSFISIPLCGCHGR